MCLFLFDLFIYFTFVCFFIWVKSYSMSLSLSDLFHWDVFGILTGNGRNKRELKMNLVFKKCGTPLGERGEWCLNIFVLCTIYLLLSVFRSADGGFLLCSQSITVTNMIQWQWTRLLVSVIMMHLSLIDILCLQMHTTLWGWLNAWCFMSTHHLQEVPLSQKTCLLYLQFP